MVEEGVPVTTVGKSLLRSLRGTEAVFLSRCSDRVMVAIFRREVVNATSERFDFIHV